MTDELTGWLADVTGEDPEVIERKAEEMDIEEPWAAEWEVQP